MPIFFMCKGQCLIESTCVQLHLVLSPSLHKIVCLALLRQVWHDRRISASESRTKDKNSSYLSISKVGDAEREDSD
jgi:hypothetical protein